MYVRENNVATVNKPVSKRMWLIFNKNRKKQMTTLFKCYQQKTEKKTSSDYYSGLIKIFGRVSLLWISNKFLFQNTKTSSSSSFEFKTCLKCLFVCFFAQPRPSMSCHPETQHFFINLRNMTLLAMKYKIMVKTLWIWLKTFLCYLVAKETDF